MAKVNKVKLLSERTSGVPPVIFSCVGNRHVVLESHLLDNGSVLPSDDQGKLILNCVSGLEVLVVILRRALHSSISGISIYAIVQITRKGCGI